MLRVYTCIAQEHDLRLVVVAGVICLLSCCIAFAAFEQARRDSARKWLWTALAAAVAGLGIWSTHFVAMLAYQPELPIGYDFGTTLLSVAAAVVVTGVGWTVALDRRRGMALAGGAILGAGVGTMHYIGMAAVEVAGFMMWDRTLVTVSVALGVVLAAVAMAIHRLAAARVARFAPVVLTLAICALHFTAMAAASIYPSNAVEVPTEDGRQRDPRHRHHRRHPGDLLRRLRRHPVRTPASPTPASPKPSSARRWPTRSCAARPNARR